jgi:glycosyltransferase involved in cell wall biosynthesis
MIRSQVTSKSRYLVYYKLPAFTLVNPPLLSALVPNYNHGQFLPKCITGILQQTMPDFEIVITDDGSTDGSPDLIRGIAKSEPRIKPVFFPTNRGVVEACKDLLKRATGKYLYCGAADDFIANKDFFKNATTALELDARPAGFYGIAGVLVAETEKLTSAMGTAEVTGFNTPLQCCEGLLKYRSVVTSPSCIWRRDLFMKHGGDTFDEHLRDMGPQADYYVNHELAWRYGMFYEKTLFACQRVFQAKTNYSANMDIFALAANLRQMEIRLRKIGLSYPDIEKDWIYWRAVNLADSIKKSGVQF